MGGRGSMPDPQSGRSERLGIVAAPSMPMESPQETEADLQLPPPKGLNDAGIRHWHYIIKGLQNKKPIESHHYPSLVRECKLVDEIALMEEGIIEHGYVYIGPNKAMCETTYSKIKDKKEAMLDRLSNLNGTNRAADERLHGTTEQPKHEDPIDDC